MVKFEVGMKTPVGKHVLMLLENSHYPQDTRVSREARALTSAGYQVSVISPAMRGQSWHESLDSVCVYRFPLPLLGNGFLGYLWEYGYSMLTTFVLSLLVYLRKRFDVIHAANPPDTFVLIAAFYKLLGVRFVYDHHDLSPEMYQARLDGRGSRLVYHALILFEKLSCRLADHVIATNQSYRTVEMQRGYVPEERITVVRNGPDLNRFRPTEPDTELRQKGQIIIGYAGIMGFQDGVDYLLRALQHLVYDLGRSDFFCVIIGGIGDARASLKVLATELGLDKYIWFTGWVSNDSYIRYLSTADICVDPDPSNPFNDRSTMIKMLEYMALEKPIVAFDLPEHRYTAQAAALYVRPNDELEFARALAELMDDPVRRQAMGLFGRRRIETQLAWCYSVPPLLDAYRAVLSRMDGKRVPCR
jgi:glycosyltransferase involved in cell wall biosynthesis